MVRCSITQRSATYRDQIEGSQAMRSVLGSGSPPPARPSRPVERLSQRRFDSMKVAAAFAKDALPCHIQHGSCRNEIQWDISEAEMRARVWPLLVQTAAGLRERVHPYALKAREAFKDLCALVEEDGEVMVELSSLRQVVYHLRSALILGLEKPEKTFDVFFAALNALAALSMAVRHHLNPVLQHLLAPLARAKGAKQRVVRDRTDGVLDILVRNGGCEATKLVKTKIPCL